MLRIIALLFSLPLLAEQVPVAWSTYRKVETVDKDYADLKAHGVGVVSSNASNNVKAAQDALADARRHGMKLHIGVSDMTERADIVRGNGLQPVDALMIGGVYQGKALDRHVFRFNAAAQQIVIEPPVYSRSLPYTVGSGGTGPRVAGEPVGHYFPDMGAPLRAEIVVPLRKFDGSQHLKIVPAIITPAPAGTKLEHDSVNASMPAAKETAERKLYTLKFDLTGLDKAMLDHVGIAVYWPYHGTNKYWLFGHGVVSAAAESTRETLRRETRRIIDVWTTANGGKFPLDVVIAMRFGDECFYPTGHVQPDSPAVNFPLWDYSDVSIAAYRTRAKNLDYPRTWGYPEIYGPDSYAWWMYSLHEAAAGLAGLVHEEIAKAAPGLLLFRNTTRAGVFDLSNDHDGSGAELLTRVLDIAHLDPYPVQAAGYRSVIPRDMTYYAGLARRYKRLLIPWMQAHTYGGRDGLQDPTPAEIDRMAAEQWKQGVDAVMWLGYGNSFPKVKPESWERAGAFHARLEKRRPVKPVAQLAVVRSYNAWSLTSFADGQIRNPADWMLQQFLEVWAVDKGLAYDVFESAPGAPAPDLKRYKYVVSSTPLPGAWLIGKGTEGQSVAPSSAQEVRARFETEMRTREWIH